MDSALDLVFFPDNRIMVTIVTINWNAGMRDTTIREAKSSLTSLIHAAEKGEPMRLTRHGKPVAVIVSIRQFQELTARRERKDPWEFLKRWRAQLPKQEPNPKVLSKFEQHRFVSHGCAPVLHELRYGTARLPPGKRRHRLTEFLDGLLEEGLEILPYDAQAAEIHADLRARLTAKDIAPTYVDGQIAAIALSRDATLATRNVDDFKIFPGLRIDNWFKP